MEDEGQRSNEEQPIWTWSNVQCVFVVRDVFLQDYGKNFPYGVVHTVKSYGPAK